MHQRIHKGVRPFQCTPCGVFFRQKAHLQKHQKTQGHIQATEIYEKKKREGGGGGSDQDSAKGSSPRDNHSSSLMIGNLMRPDSVRSVDSNGSASTLSLLADSTSPTSSSNLVANESFSPGLKAKSSPKRKQAKPSQLLVSENNNESHEDSEELLEREEAAQEMEEDCRVSTSEDKLNAFIDYNDLNHGYDCNQCTFASHDLALMKEHVREEHLNLSKGFHTNLLHFKPLMSHLSPTNSLSIEHRMAKKRKVDSLAESIRQKKEMKSLQESNNLSSPPAPTSSSTPIFSPKNRLKSSMHRSPVHRLSSTPPPPPPHPPATVATSSSDPVAIAASLLSLQPQPLSQLLHKHGRSENNNVLSSLHANLKLPPSVQLPTKPVAGLTPPSSPPPMPQGGQIRGEVSVTIVGGGSNSEDSDHEGSGENGLDLSISKRRNSDEHEVSTSSHPASQLSDFYGRLPPIPPPAPHHHLPVAPFPFLPPLPPGVASDHPHPALAEHLLKLASLHPRGPLPPPIPPPELPKVPGGGGGANSSPYTVLSAMLGHHTTSHFPTVFPGMPSVFPSTSSVPAGTSPAASIKEEPQIGTP